MRLLLAGLGIVAALVSARLQADSSPFVAGHLYVTIPAAYGYSGPLVRFPITNGVPSARPDLIYSDVSPPFSVDTDGTLYDLEPINNTFGVTVFPPNSTIPRRRVLLPNPYSTDYQGLLAHGGYIYPAFIWNPSSRHRMHEAARTSGSGLCDEMTAPAILVYGPSARGQAPWLQCFPTGVDYFVSFWVWMALDGRGDLYVPSAWDQIVVIANPRTHPQVVRSMQNGMFANIHAVADDGHGYLYALGGGSQGEQRASYFVSTYADSGNGAIRPIRTLYYPSFGAQENLAVDDRYLYISTGSGVFIYDKTASGHALPRATLPTTFSGTNLMIAISR